MAGNGKGRPPRPRIELVGGGADAAEAAAVMAALERFLEEARPPAAAAAPASRWQQAALHEGVRRDPALPSWGAPDACGQDR